MTSTAVIAAASPGPVVPAFANPINEWVRRVVGAGLATVGVYAVGWGLVDSATWAAVSSPDTVAAIAGLGGALIYGAFNLSVKVATAFWLSRKESIMPGDVSYKQVP